MVRSPAPPFSVLRLLTNILLCLFIRKTKEHGINIGEKNHGFSYERALHACFSRGHICRESVRGEWSCEKFTRLVGARVRNFSLRSVPPVPGWEFENFFWLASGHVSSFILAPRFAGGYLRVCRSCESLGISASLKRIYMLAL